MQNDSVNLLAQYYSVWQEFNVAYEKWAKTHGISVNTLFVLLAISEGGEDCTQKKISQRWSIPKQTTNMVLKELDEHGYVSMTPMDRDKRNKRISFTDDGREYAESILSELRRTELSVVEHMGDERMRKLNEDTELFLKLFKDAGGL